MSTEVTPGIPVVRQGRRVVAVGNQKGGVGKSTVTMNFAAVTAEELDRDPLTQLPRVPRQRRKVALVSADQQGSAEWWTNRRKNGRKATPFDFFQVHTVEQFNAVDLEPYAAVFFDLPGHLTQPELVEAAMRRSTEVLVPMLAESLSLIPTRRFIEQVVQPVGLDYHVVINNWESRATTDLHNAIRYIQRRNWPMLPDPIRRFGIHHRSAALGQVVTEYPPTITGLKALADFRRGAAALGFCTLNEEEVA